MGPTLYRTLRRHQIRSRLNLILRQDRPRFRHYRNRSLCERTDRFRVRAHESFRKQP